MTKAIDHAGIRYGRLVATSKAENSRSGRIRWNCTCDCGNSVVVQTNALVSGNTRSCGCIHDEVRKTARKTHGMRKTSLYNIWNGIKIRCTNKNSAAYKDYGGRGITVCDRWLNSFENFFADMGDRPSAQHSIDRINNDLGYSPDNCRWATKGEQSRNTRKNIFLEHDGLLLCVSDWSSMYGICDDTIIHRIRNGWSASGAITTKAGGEKC